MLLVLNNLSFVYLGSASWEEFVRKSELESENSTFKLRLGNYDHYHQIKKYLNKTKAVLEFESKIDSVLKPLLFPQSNKEGKRKIIMLVRFHYVSNC